MFSKFNAADFNDSVAFLSGHAGGFGIQTDLSHVLSFKIGVSILIN